MNRIRTATATAAVLLGVLTGCGGQGAGRAADPATATATASAPSSAAPPAESPAGPPAASPSGPAGEPLGPPTGTDEVKVERSPEEPPLVTGVRYAGHAGYDRVVIDLKGEKTGYTVRWVEQLVQDGSGDPIPVRGGAYLLVALFPAAAHTESGEATWGREPVRQADLTNVRSVVKAGDFEGVVSVGIVLDRKAGFRVLELSGPPRLVIDVAH